MGGMRGGESRLRKYVELSGSGRNQRFAGLWRRSLEARVSITIYLLRESVKSPEDAVVSAVDRHVIANGSSVYGVLFTKQNPPKPPKWANLFEDFVEAHKLGLVQSTSAVFIVETEGRLFAVTFGHGRFILKPEAFEERFGLLVTLNSVDRKSTRLNSSHVKISYAVFCLKKKKRRNTHDRRPVHWLTDLDRHRWRLPPAVDLQHPTLRPVFATLHARPGRRASAPRPVQRR